MKIHINTEEDLELLDRKINMYDAYNHIRPYLICSEETKQFLYKYKESRFPKMKDVEWYNEADMYYICQVIVDNSLPFGEIEIKEFR
jgi:hypothetical protein